MGSIPVAGAKKEGDTPCPPLFWHSHMRTHLCAARRMGFASCELARRELAHGRREQGFSPQARFLLFSFFRRSKPPPYGVVRKRRISFHHVGVDVHGDPRAIHESPLQKKIASPNGEGKSHRFGLPRTLPPTEVLRNDFTQPCRDRRPRRSANKTIFFAAWRCNCVRFCGPSGRPVPTRRK